MRRRAVWVGGLSAVVMMLGGCAEAPSRSELVEALERSGLPTAKAECAADAVMDELTEDEIVDIVQRGPAGAPRDDPNATDDPSDRVRAALAECREVGEESTTTVPSSDQASSDTTTTAGVEDTSDATSEPTESTEPPPSS